jgi:hypothetical protein
MKYTVTTAVGSIATAVFLGLIALRPLTFPQKVQAETPVKFEHNVLDLRKIPDNPLDIVRALDSASSGGYRVKAAAGPIVILEKD